MSQKNYFDLLGLPTSYQIDRKSIEDNYLSRSRKVHPDRFIGASELDQRRAQVQSAELNVAYRTVKNRVARAEYLVKLGGIDLASSDPKVGAPKPTQAFLMEMLEWREKLDAEQSVDGISSLRDEVENSLSARFSNAVRAIEEQDTARAAHELVARRYFQRLLEEIDATEDEA